jgi:hypothetical protein
MNGRIDRLAMALRVLAPIALAILLAACGGGDGGGNGGY